MRYFTLLLGLFLVGWTSTAKTADSNKNYRYKSSNAIIFVERGVEFAVYTNGEFDFNFNPNYARTSNLAFTPFKNIRSYNSGYDYGRYVQYDDYGAVVQIENIPIYYDYYGRIVQAGNVFINYNHRGQVSRVGGLNVQYNRFNQPYRYTGFINAYNRGYEYKPWHKYYSRPDNRYRVVYYEPYRAYYEPMRVDYNTYVYHPHNLNKKLKKHKYYRPGERVVVYNHGRRTSSERSINGVRNSTQAKMENNRSNQNARVRSNNSVRIQDNRDNSRNIDNTNRTPVIERDTRRSVNSSTKRGLTEKEIREKYAHKADRRSVNTSARVRNTEADKPYIEESNNNLRGRSRVYKRTSVNSSTPNEKNRRNIKSQDTGIKAGPATSKSNIRAVVRGRSSVMN